MSLPNEVIVSTSKLTAIGDAVRSRFGVSGDLTLDEMAENIMPSLPSGYTEVDYVEATGTQYIDTGVVDEGEFEIFSKVNVYSTSSTEAAIFSTWNSTSNYWNLFVSSSSPHYVNLYCKGHHQSDTSFKTNNEYELSLRRVNNAWSCLFYDGYRITPVYFSQSASGNSTTIKMFIRGDGNTGDHTLRIGRTKMTKGGTEVRYFIPCYRNADNVIGMYDTVNGQFYTNSGSGNFTCYPSPSN